MTSPNTRSHLSLTRFAIALTLLSGLLVACSKSDKAGGAPQGAGMPPLPVTVVAVQPSHAPMSLEAVGQTEGAKEVEVRARVGGILLKQLYTEGETVKAGQALFEIDRAPLEIALAEAKAQLSTARAKVEQTNREAKRLKGLLALQAISQREFDDATSNDAIALAALQAADALLRQAELNLSYATVTSPVAGTSGRAIRSVGTLVSTGSDSLLTTVTQMNPIWVRFSLSDSEIAQLPGGRVTRKNVHGVELVLPDGSTYPARGRLNFAASQIDPKLGTLQLRAEFDNPDARLLPGQFVRARLLTGDRSGIFLLPQSAVMQSEKGHFVFIASPKNTVEPRPVETGQWQGTDWVILGGLKAGDKVILDNLMKLRPGAPIMPHAAGDKPPASQNSKA